MCAIFGMCFLNGHRVGNMNYLRLALDILFKESQARGRQAAGISFTTPSDIAVLKDGVSATELIQSDAYRQACTTYMNDKTRLLSIIGHCRHPTKGSKLDNNNNHPIVSNRVIGVHNGMIGNDEAIWDQYDKFAPKSWRRAGQVDSEIIFRLLDYYLYEQVDPQRKAIRHTCRQLTGSYACAFNTTRDKYMVWLFRHNNPIDVVFFPKMGMIIFASQKRFIDTALEGMNLGKAVTIDVPNDSGVGFDLFKNKRMPFKLETPVTIKKQAGFLAGADQLPGVTPPPPGEA